MVGLGRRPDFAPGFGPSYWHSRTRVCVPSPEVMAIMPRSKARGDQCGEHWAQTLCRPGDCSMNDTPHSQTHFWLRELPHAAVWVLTIFGVAYTSFAKRALITYWEFLAIVIGILCVVT